MVHKKSEKRPVLTSPWKIGMLVALMLLVVGFGVGYYVVSVYDIDLKWLKGASGSWGVDSYLFFKEIYPVLASVILVSLFSYFIVASGVRRYKFYLDSGQDYRKMIALADSVDDLTNPSQIAKLSDYPELQNVLRNYGDQIREISQEIDQREEEERSVDLEMEIDTLLRGESVQDSLIDGKWWTQLYKKVKSHVQDARTEIDDLKMQNEIVRGILSQVVLSNGKIMESAGGSSDDLLEIVRAVGELNSLAKMIDESEFDASASGTGMERDISPAVVNEMKDTLQKLEQGSRMLNEFSENNNGLALNLALMAAKGSVGEHELAQYAEKARSTAERFKQLGNMFSGITQSLHGSCNRIGETTGSGHVACAEDRSHIQESVSSISGRIEDKSKMLQQRICNLKNELGDTNELLQEGLRKFTSTMKGEDAGEGPIEVRETTMVEESEIVNFGVGGDEGIGIKSDLVIDHGKMWEEGDSFSDGFGSTVEIAGETPADDGVVEDAVEAEGECLALGDVQGNGPPMPKVDEVEEGSLRQTQIFPRDVREETGKSDSGEGWMKMPGHRWVKVDVEKEEHEKAGEDVNVKTADDSEVEVDDLHTRSSSVSSGVDEEESEISHETADSEEVEDGEPVYDLFELGAVEYCEESNV